MKAGDLPNLLIVRNLLAPIDRSATDVQKAMVYCTPTTDPFLLRGLFVIALSFMEAMLTDVLEYFLTSFPLKIPSNEFKYEKDVYFTSYRDLTAKTVERYLNSLAYRSFEDHFTAFLELTSIHNSSVLQTHVGNLKEARATRNVLLHNSLLANNLYLASAGDLRRTSRAGERLECDHPYVTRTIETISAFAIDLRKSLSEKYSEYTKIRANKELWNFMFKSPIMQYDDYWVYSVEEDSIPAFKYSDRENQLANSERLLLALWRSHYGGSGNEAMQSFNMKHFDNRNQAKILYFLSIAESFPFS